MVSIFCLLAFSACKNELHDIEKEARLSENYTQIDKFDLSVTSDKVKVINGRLVFADYDVFFQTADALSSLSQEEMLAWVQKMGFPSLLFYNLNNSNHPNRQYLSDLEISPRYLLLMNAQGEYQIGNYIHWCDTDGVFYFIPNANEKLLKQVKANPKKSNVPNKKYIKSIIEVDTPTTNNDGFTTYAVVIPGNTADARYQYQYSYGGHTYKMVFEVSSYTYWNYIGTNVVCSNEIYSSVKLEYRKNNGTWAMAGESATKSISNGYYSITPDIGNVCCPPTYTSNFSGYINSNQPLHIKLGQTFNWEEALDWNVTVSGNYYENVSIHNKTYSLSPASW
ncbi:MAG: hypothetical protein MUE81_12050 [Thermoflexibacter sp.]|jgi:hypothetical protein|nr:hypothetical protein [Thermoflexibacter sp.]